MSTVARSVMPRSSSFSQALVRVSFIAASA
jgi:hypothetical protein